MAINILDELKNDFLTYAGEVNQNRSFPDARDGLKPSQRAILWEMFSKGYSSAKPHVKSAKVSGGTIASWWPHGDVGIYEAMGRMSQNWVNNIPEIDWHGANGSQLGGPQLASSRYTECRLSKATEDGMLSDIKKNAVDMIKNFSEDEEWPSVLPALMPRLFVNGSQGIGYTIAQEWEPGNLIEFTAQVKSYIKKGKIDYNSIAPDYPTGGVIINKSSMPDIYKTGRGNILLRAYCEVEDNIIKVKELPYQVYAEDIIQKIKDLVNDGTLSGIEDICNKSDDSGLLIEIECSDNTDVVLSKLYKYTDLQVTFSANQIALVNGIPTELNLKDYIKVYVDHNIDCLVRETTFDKNKAESDLEIINGLIKACSILDDIINCIRSAENSSDAEKKLVSKFGFTERQAKAIVDMKLGKLAKTDVSELNIKHDELNSIITKCESIINSKENQYKEFIKKLEAFTTKYGTERKTRLTDVNIVEEKSKVRSKKEPEDYMVILSDNQIKKIKMVDFKQKSTTSNTVRCKADSKVFIINDSGIMFRLPVKKIPVGNMKSTGLDLKEYGNVIKVFSGTETEPYVFFSADNGYVKKMSSEVLFKVSKTSGTVVMKLSDGVKILNISMADDKDEFLFDLSNKKSKVIKVSDFNERGKSAGGVKGIKLKDKQIISVLKMI